MRNRFTLPAVLVCLTATLSARADPIPVVGYDITDATLSGFGGWSHTYTGTITQTTGSAVDYTGGGGTLNDGIFGTTLDTIQLFLQGLVNGIPVRPVIVLKLGAAATVQQIRISGGNLGGNFFPGQITGVTAEIGGQSVAIATIPDGPLSDVGVPIDDIVQITGTGLELIPTDTVILRDVIVPDSTGNQFSITEIGVDGVSTAPPPGKRLDFVSDATWRVTGSNGARLGFAQTVCLNDFSPCAPATTYYNYPVAGWPISAEIPGAKWIWAPGVEASTAPASLSRYTFSRSFMLGKPTLGEMFIQADDYAQITVNGKVVGEIGSINDIGLAGQAQAGQSFDITSFLKPGRNVISVTGQNGPYTFGSDDPNADYSENPGGVVFGGRIFSVSRASAAIDLLNAALDQVRSLADGQFRNPHMRRAFAQKLAATIQLVDLREFDEAVEKLRSDLLQKTNGCGRTGTPDRNDWIIDCAAQAQIEELLRQAIAVLGDPGANR